MALSKWPEVEEKLILVEAWCRDGLTDKDIADKLGISEKTFYDYKNKYPQFSQSLKKGKEVADVEVENSLFKRANGYKYDEVTRESVPVRDEEGKITGYEMVETKRVTKEVQPDVTAQIFWLKNRKPKEWRDKQEHEITGDISINIQLDD